MTETLAEVMKMVPPPSDDDVVRIEVGSMQVLEPLTTRRKPSFDYTFPLTPSIVGIPVFINEDLGEHELTIIKRDDTRQTFNFKTKKEVSDG